MNHNKDPEVRVIDTFIEQARRTESHNFTVPNARILHAAMGCVTEAGEMLDALKKSTFYGKPLDNVNIREEAGDLLWYLAILFDEVGTSFEVEMARVVKKLQIRYPDKFSEEHALTRNLAAEREVLEKD